MSSKQTVMGPRGPEKAPGWFSWRHQTSTEHDLARATYLAEHGPAARRRKAQERMGAKVGAR
jgi:hypothetical protein